MSKVVKKQFNAMATSYDKYAFNQSRGLELVDSLEKSFVEKVLRKNKKEEIYIDLGIGTGRFSKSLLKKGKKVYGLDFSKEMIEVAKRELKAFLKSGQIRFELHDLNKPLLYPDNTFDGAVCIRVIKYVKHWEKLIGEIARVLKPEGVLILEISNKYSVQSISSLFTNYFTFNPGEVELILKEHGFRIENKGYGFKLPLFFYSKINSKSALKVVQLVEKVLFNLFGPFLSRNIIYHCQKDATEGTLI